MTAEQERTRDVVVQIRRATTRDVPQLVELWVEFMDFHSALDPKFERSAGARYRWTEYITSKIDAEDYRILVATDGENLVGYIVAIIQNYPPIRTIESYGFIQEIAVAQRFRRKGIARRLLRRSEEWLQEAGIRQVEVKIDVANEVSQKLFRGEGFDPLAETLIKKYGCDD